MVANSQEWITVAEAATLTGKPEVTIRRWARESDVDAIKSGGVWLLRTADVLKVATDGPGKRGVSDLTEDPARALEQAWARVSRDVERDKLPDIINHADFGANIAEEVARIAASVAHGYDPSPVRVVEMPKTLIASRPLAELLIDDRLVYEACIQTVAPTIDARLHDHVYSHRLVSKPKGRRLVRYFGEQYRQFEEYVSEIVWEETQAQVCLTTDIASFFEYIEHERLLDVIGARPEHQDVIVLLRRLLRGWRTYAGVVGLPQGPDGSGILANAYLTEVDSTCLARADAYARFSDDMRIFFKIEEEAAEFAPKFVRALRHLGLNMSSAKTFIKPKSDIADNAKAARRARVSYMLESLDVESLEELREMFDEATIDRFNVDTTDFTFSAWRLGQLEDDYPLRRILELLPFVPFSAAIVADYLARVGYRPEVRDAVTDYLLHPMNVHPWVEIHLLRLVGLFDEVSPRLLNRMRELVESDRTVLGDFAARVLGAVGEPHDRRNLVYLATRDDTEPSRRRACAIGGAEREAGHEWADRLLEKPLEPRVHRAAKFVAQGHVIGPTLIQMRLLPTIRPLRARLEEQNLLPARDPIPPL